MLLQLTLVFLLALPLFTMPEQLINIADLMRVIVIIPLYSFSFMFQINNFVQPTEMAGLCATIHRLVKNEGE